MRLSFASAGIAAAVGPVEPNSAAIAAEDLVAVWRLAEVGQRRKRVVPGSKVRIAAAYAAPYVTTADVPAAVTSVGSRSEDDPAIQGREASATRG